MHEWEDLFISFDSMLMTVNASHSFGYSMRIRYQNSNLLLKWLRSECLQISENKIHWNWMHENFSFKHSH
jgi:hypothetical protein